MDTLNYPAALTAMLEGKKVTRQKWNGKNLGMDMHTAAQFPDTHSKMGNPYLYMSVDGVMTPWHPSNLDQFAQDWSIVE